MEIHVYTDFDHAIMIKTVGYTLLNIPSTFDRLSTARNNLNNPQE